MTPIFVFGSNLLGIHGAGAALHAQKYHGANWKVGQGPRGMSYAIPTKRTPYQSLTYKDVYSNIQTFLAYATYYVDRETFFVTRVGCGLAGFKDKEIAEAFKLAPSNCIMPPEWKPFLGPEYEYHSGVCVHE